MFGTLAAVDMKRKWTIWQIPSPYMDFVTQKDATTQTLDICNGINSSKIYQLSTTQYSDDGVAINSLYTTYGFVNAAKAVTMPIFRDACEALHMVAVQCTGIGRFASESLSKHLICKISLDYTGCD